MIQSIYYPDRKFMALSLSVKQMNLRVFKLDAQQQNFHLQLQEDEPENFIWQQDGAHFAMSSCYEATSAMRQSYASLA